jgi:threonine synthase
VHYYSTNHKSPRVSFREAAITGQPQDKGLYFPSEIPHLSDSFFRDLKSKSKAEIAFEVIRPYIAGEIPDEELFGISEETVNFDFPLVKISETVSSLELYHGPTMAFKDVGARFMSRCLGYFSKDSNRHVTILVATSGDTGSAVANGFLGVKNVEVVILYPSGKVSNIQELQLTTLGQNITALEINGTFDDCQAMVKQAFTDSDLNKKLSLTSANSINIARWLPQQFYYFYALQQWDHKEPPVISVPSGNFGNICAGLVAFKSGLPVDHFIAACNSNDIFPSYLLNGEYKPKPSVATYSNAMDVGDPSNFVRLLGLFGNDISKIRQVVSGCSINDTTTLDTISRVYRESGYLLEPHGAVAFKALDDYLDQHPGKKGILLETAHPIKFVDVVEKSIGEKIAVPDSSRHLLGLKKQSVLIDPEFGKFKELLLARS